jgi:hypothetical protein
VKRKIALCRVSKSITFESGEDLRSIVSVVSSATEIIGDPTENN